MGWDGLAGRQRLCDSSRALRPRKRAFLTAQRVRSAIALTQALAGMPRRCSVGSRGTAAARDARQAITTDRLLPSALLPGLLW